MSEAISLPAFTVAGITARTNNAREMSGDGVIAQMWQRWMSENLIQRIPNRLSDDVYAVYSNYESDASGDYDFLIGVKVEGNETAHGMSIIQIPESQFKLLKTEEGQPWQTVPAAWKRIWDELTPERNFANDFELYAADQPDPHHCVVELWVGLK